MPDEPVAQLLESDVVYEGRVFRVDVDRVRLPNDRTVHIDVVRHRPSVILVPMPDANHVILIRQYRHAVGTWLWEVPAGSIDPGETPEQAARRECHEEIGLVPERVVRIGTYLPTPGYCDEEMAFFRVEDLRQPTQAAEADPDELIVPQTVTLVEARAMVARGDIPDMKSALALLLV
jgi:ADP-ribose pyrophosphatase